MKWPEVMGRFKGLIRLSRADRGVTGKAPGRSSGNLWREFSGKTNNDDLESVLQAANKLSKANRFAEAERLLQEATAQWPGHPDLMEGLARVSQQQWRWPEALKRWRALADCHPKNAFAQVQLAQTLTNLHQPEEAERILSDILRQMPTHPGATVAMAKTLLLMGRPAEAEEILTKHGDRFADNPKFIRGLAQTAEHRQQWPKALAHWQALRQHNYDDFGALAQSHIAHCLLKLGRIDDARRLIMENVGAQEEGRALKELFREYAPFICYYGLQVEGAFTN